MSECSKCDNVCGDYGHDTCIQPMGTDLWLCPDCLPEYYIEKLDALRASHKRLVEALKLARKALDDGGVDCPPDAPHICGSCPYAHSERCVCDIADEAIIDAEKLQEEL